MFPNLDAIGIRRRRLGATQSAFAKSVGISQSMLTKIERGKVMPSYGMAIKIFEKLQELEKGETKTAAEVMRKKVFELKNSDTVGTAATLAKRHSLSQFPVVSAGRIVGSISTTDLVGLDRGTKIGWKMQPPFPTVNEETPIGIVKELIKHEKAVVVARRGEIVGIITAEDLL